MVQLYLRGFRVAWFLSMELGYVFLNEKIGGVRVLLLDLYLQVLIFCSKTILIENPSLDCVEL